MKPLFIKTLEENKEIIFRICSSYSSSQEDTKDLFQEVVFNIWKSLPSFRNKASIQTWVYRITLNVCLRAKVQDNQRKKHIDFNSIKIENLENAAISSADHKAYSELYSCIKKLNDVDRSLILLFLQELPYKEISEVTGLTENHIAVKIKRIKNKLLVCLETKNYVR